MAVTQRFTPGFRLLNGTDLNTAFDQVNVSLDPATNHSYFNDFDIYTATDWTVTETQAGATQAIVAGGDGGQLILTNSAADNDINAIELVNKTFVLSASKAFEFETRIKVDDIELSDILVGLVDTMAALNPAYGIYLYRDPAAGTLRLSVENNSVVTNSSVVVHNGTDDAFYVLGIVYDPAARVVVASVDGQEITRIVDITNFPTVALAPAVGLRNGSAAARTLTTDYVLATKAR